VRKASLKTWLKLVVFFLFMALLTSLLTLGAPESLGKTTWDRGWSAFTALFGFVVMTMLVVYPLLIRLNRALISISIKNQVLALMDLSKDANWDANDMGRRLSKLFAWNQANGERLINGVLLAGFPSMVLEEFAEKQDDQKLLKIILEYREKENGHFLDLLLLAPWCALLAFIGLPFFVKAFLAWSLASKMVFFGIWLFIYGAIPAKALLEIAKGK